MQALHLVYLRNTPVRIFIYVIHKIEQSKKVNSK